MSVLEQVKALSMNNMITVMRKTPEAVSGWDKSVFSVWLSAQQLHLASDKYSLTHDNQNISNECQFKIGIGDSEAGCKLLKKYFQKIEQID